MGKDGRKRMNEGSVAASWTGADNGQHSERMDVHVAEVGEQTIHEAAEEMLLARPSVYFDPDF